MFTFILIGIVIGLSSGLFGIGGALIATPLLKVAGGLTALLALATPLPASIPSALSGSVNYYRNGLIDFRVAGWVLCTALPVNMLSAYASHYVSSQALMIATAVVMMYVALSFVVRAWLLRESDVAETPAVSTLACLLVGILTGVMSGLLAVGGGIVMVPAFLRFLGLRLRAALATSLMCVAALSIPGTIIHGSLGHIDWSVAFILALISVPFSYLGSVIALRLRARHLERIYGVFMLLFALYFLWTVMHGS